MAKEKQSYTITVKYPRDSSSNVSEVDWFTVTARSEKEAIHKAKMKAASRLDAFLTISHFGPNPRPL